MKKIDASQILKNVDGMDIKLTPDDVRLATLGRTLSVILGQCLPAELQGMNPVKAWELSKKFSKEGMVEMDKADYVAVRDTIKEHPKLEVRISAPILGMLDEAEEVN
jgi:uncharacterized protein with von Willebrand factor type A (vWA) domain